MSSFDIQATRAAFPALKKEQVYFDNAGGSQTLGTAIDSIHEYLIHTNVQLGGSYAVGKQTNQKYATGYEAAAKHINASKDNIVLGSSTTQLFRNLSQALSFPAGSEIIISSIDHEANIASWVALASIQSLTIKWWNPSKSPNPSLTPDSLKPLLSSKTALVTCTHASNILGTIHDIAALSTLVHTIPNALFCVDGVAYAPHRPLDMQALGVDFYCFSWYKVYGPHISVLYASPAALPKLKSLAHFFNPSNTLSEKLGLAGSCYELTAALPAVVEYLDTQSWEGIRAHEEELQKVLLEYLGSRKDVTIMGEKSWDAGKRVSTISFVVEGKGSRGVVESVDEATDGLIGIRWGAFYSNRLCEEVLGLGKEGVVRVSMVHYNTGELAIFPSQLKHDANRIIVEEVKRLIEVFDKVLGKS
ncbi:aminotransferase class-v protein [Rutstroemia sp. NJR-2017a BBW]|nr:aminotransferase class-v protein [Rutstroemia sp. NJR-2017a BBW]